MVVLKGDLPWYNQSVKKITSNTSKCIMTLGGSKNPFGASKHLSWAIYYKSLT